MKEIVDRIALEVGGAHYPEVGGELLQRFAKRLVEECVEVINLTPTHCAFTTHDYGVVKCTIEKSVTTLKEHFKV